MALLSNRNDFDKLAGKRAQCALDSQKESMTVMEICEAASYPPPVSAADWKAFVRMCSTWGIHCNIDQEPVIWKAELCE